MYKSVVRKNSNRTKTIMGFVLVIVLFFGAILTLESMGITDLYDARTETVELPVIEATGSSDAINYDKANPEDNFLIPDKDPATNPSTIPVLGAAITSTRVNSTGTMYLIKVAVSGTNTGTCQVSMSNGTKTITEASDISLLGGQYGCTKLEIPVSKLTEKGTWKIEVQVTDSSGAAVTTTSEVIL